MILYAIIRACFKLEMLWLTHVAVNKWTPFSLHYGTLSYYRITFNTQFTLINLCFISVIISACNNNISPSEKKQLMLRSKKLLYSDPQLFFIYLGHILLVWTGQNTSVVSVLYYCSSGNHVFFIWAGFTSAWCHAHFQYRKHTPISSKCHCVCDLEHVYSLKLNPQWNKPGNRVYVCSHVWVSLCLLVNLPLCVLSFIVKVDMGLAKFSLLEKWLFFAIQAFLGSARVSSSLLQGRGVSWLSDLFLFHSPRL